MARIYKSSFKDVEKFSNFSVFEFLFTKNPNLKPDNVALIDAISGDKVSVDRSCAFARADHSMHRSPTSK